MGEVVSRVQHGLMQIYLSGPWKVALAGAYCLEKRGNMNLVVMMSLRCSHP